MSEQPGALTPDNFTSMALRHRDRQAGVSMIYDPETDIFVYNAYCLELKLLKELFSHECATLEEALAVINDQFSTWELTELAVASEGCAGGCGGGCSCGSGCGSGGCSCGAKNHHEE